MGKGFFCSRHVFLKKDSGKYRYLRHCSGSCQFVFIVKLLLLQYFARLTHLYLQAMNNIEEIKNLGLKATGPRLTILELFQRSSARHLSAEDVFRELTLKGQDIGLATVYRVLTQFEQAGLLSRSNFDNDKAVYELNDGEHHDHLVCLDCGQVKEFHDPEIERLQHEVARKNGFELVEHALSLYGHCQLDNCPHRKKK